MKLRRWFGRLRHSPNWIKWEHKLKEWGRMLLNPRLFLCLFIAWMLTNGWSYLFFGIGMLLKINWMRIVGGAYMSFLWLPFTPEKLLTVLIAVFLLRVLYPRDRQTLLMLKMKLARLRRRRDAQ